MPSNLPPHRLAHRDRLGHRLLVPIFLALCLALGGAAGAQADGRVRIEFWTIDLARNFTDYVESTVEVYENAHPDVDLVWRDLPLGDVGEELARSRSAGTAPDLVNVNVPLALDFAERGLLLDLDASLGAEDRERYFDDLLTSFRIDGRQIALPWYLTMPVLFYDGEAFERAGLDPAHPPATTAEVHAAARTLHERLGVPGIWPNLTGQQILYRFLEAGLPVADTGGRRAVFDGDEHAAHLGELVDLFAVGVIPAEAFDEGSVTATDAFLAGRLPMITANPQLLGRLQTANPSLHERVRVAPYPLGPGQSIHAPLMGLAVAADSAHPEEALAFARFLTGEERQLAFARRTAILPSARGAAADPYFRGAEANGDGASGAGTAPTTEARARQVAASQLPYARDLTMELPNASELFARFEQAIEHAFFRYETPQEALHAAARFWNALL